MTESQWIDALREASQVSKSVDGLTTADVADKLGVCPSTARERIRTAILKGIMKYAGVRNTPGISGRMGSTPVYQFVEKPNAPKKGRNRIDNARNP